MKVCPKCGSTTTDETQSFCLMDGIQLVPGESQPTVAMPSVSTQTTISPVRRKRRIGLWVTIGVLFLLLGGGALAAMLIYAYRLGSESTRNSQVDTNVSQPMRSAPSPKTASTTPQSSPPVAAAPASTPVAAPQTEAVESTPITWNTSASTFKQDIGLTYTFDCPPEGTRGVVWGSDVYTADSSICTAAVHAGKITLEKGGQVTIEFKAGRSTYGATTRNGVTSYNFGEYPKSFVFK